MTELCLTAGSGWGPVVGGAASGALPLGYRPRAGEGAPFPGRQPWVWLPEAYTDRDSPRCAVKCFQSLGEGSKSKK